MLAIVALLGLAACNPLISDPISLGGELDESSARYVGPDAAWLEVAVSGAPDHVVFALALIGNDDLRGPTSRSCAGPTVTPCEVNVSDVRMPNQRTVSGDFSQSVPLMQIWSDETVHVVLVCVDPETQELGCPPAVRTALRAVDAAGGRVGVLVPAAPL